MVNKFNKVPIEINEQKITDYENNAHLINEWTKYVKILSYEYDKNPNIKNQFRLRSGKSVLSTIKKYPYVIVSGEQLKHIKDVGKESVKKINEILETGTLSFLSIPEELNKELNSIQELSQIYKLKSQAVKLYEQGIDSIEKLKIEYEKGNVKLNKSSAIALKYSDFVNERIPKEEIDDLNYLIEENLPKINKKMKHVIAGSYRRENPTSGDVDLILYHPKLETRDDVIDSKKNYLKLFVNEMTKLGIIIDTLEIGKLNFKGYFMIYEDIPRRIDINIVPTESLSVALLHHTGSDKFVIYMTKLAEKKGYKLNVYHLTDRETGYNLNIDSEEDIFEILEIDYIPPNKRNF